ncbi:TPA: EpsG family protein [Photobacterium damselae]
MKLNLRSLSISCFTIIIYIISCYLWSRRIMIYGDTEAYFHAYENIKNISNPYGVEFILSAIMNIVDIANLSFRDLLFILLLLWFPIVGILSYKSYKSPVFIFAVIFFFLYQFNQNATFLIRSYLSILFFMLFIVIKIKAKFIFLLLSFFSQISSVVFFLAYNNYMYNLLLISRARSFSLLFLVVVLSRFISNNIFSYIDFSYLYGVFPDAINRKLSFYQGSIDIGSSNVFIILLAILLGLMIILIKKKESRKKFDALIFSQVLICVLFSNINVLANRLGIIAFMFSIPLICFYINERIKNN